MRDPVKLMTVAQLRLRLSELGAIHSSLGWKEGMINGSHRGWANCECSLAKLLRQYSDRILVLLKLDRRKA